MGKNVEVMLNDVELSFFHGFRPQERKNDDGVIVGYNYNTAVLIRKKEQADQIEKVKAAMKEAREDEWGDNPPRIPGDRYCLRDGEPKDPETEQPVPLYEGYEGCMVLSANNVVSVEDYELIKAGKKEPPIQIIGPRKSKLPNGKLQFVPLSENSEFAPYSGCRSNVMVNIYAFNKPEKGPARLNASLEVVQFKDHGTRRGGRAPVDVDSKFDEVEGYDDMDTGTSGTTSGGGSAAAADDDLLG